MEEYRVLNNKLTNDECIIDDATLQLFIGRNIDLKIRNGKTITISRERGHVKLYDTKFILSAKYKQKSDGFIYTCVDIDKDNNAVMKSDNDCMDITYDDNVYMWEVM